MLRIMSTRTDNAEELADIITEFVKAAKEYLAFGTRNKDPEMDMKRADGTIICFERAVAKIVEHIVINPEIAARSRDNVFEDIGFLQGLAHINREINPHGEIFDIKLAQLRAAIRDTCFLRCVSHRHLKATLGLP